MKYTTGLSTVSVHTAEARLWHSTACGRDYSQWRGRAICCLSCDWSTEIWTKKMLQCVNSAVGAHTVENLRHNQREIFSISDGHTGWPMCPKSFWYSCWCWEQVQKKKELMWKRSWCKRKEPSEQGSGANKVRLQQVVYWCNISVSNLWYSYLQRKISICLIISFLKMWNILKCQRKPARLTSAVRTQSLPTSGLAHAAAYFT